MDYYAILGIERGSNPEQIKAAFKAQAKVHHPDVGGDEEQFKRVNEAYEALKNPQPTRDFYHGFKPQPQSQQRRNFDLSITVKTSLSDLFKNEERHIKVRMSTGHREYVKLIIPSSVNTGQTIRYEGLGDNAIPDRPRGALFARVLIDDDKDYEKRDLDLITCLTVDCFSAILGTVETIKPPSGKTLQVTIPPGTQYGTVLKIKGEGYTSNHRTGDILAVISVRIPTHLPDDQVVLINKLTKKDQ